MPTGSYTSHLEENEFKPKSSIMMAIEWLKWVAYRDRIYMRHQLNNTEKDIGDRKLPVDDLNAQTQKFLLATPLLKFPERFACIAQVGKKFTQVVDKPD